jgi:hypothetical protein
MRSNTGMVVAALLTAVLAGPVAADGAGAQFSADMVRHGPDGQATAGKMFVGDRRTRMEMTQKGHEIVRISDEKRGTEWVLFPADKTYLERGAPAGSPAAPNPPPAAPSAETDPCTGVPGLTCRRVGTEDVNGRAAVKWEMSATEQGQTLTGTQWIDVERGLPLKYLMPNGQTMELKLVGPEKFDGRAVEKWEVTSTVPNQQPVATFQWYDPELKLAVREEFPGGYVSELKNIKVGAQPDDLFAVPAGYTLKAMPTPGAQPQPGGK